MEIEYKNKKMVQFKSLYAGGLFILYEKLYIKINYSCTINAFNITDAVTCTVEPNVLVESVDATLVVNRK